MTLPPPPPMPPPPPGSSSASVAPPPTGPSVTASSSSTGSAPAPPPIFATLSAWASGLRADLGSKTPKELLDRYKWYLVGLAVLIFMVVRLTYLVLALSAVTAAVCLIAGWKDPQTFRLLLGDKTSKNAVGWTFGGLFFICCGLMSLCEPRNVDPDLGVTPAPATAPITSPVHTPIPAVEPAKRSAAQTRADAAQTRERMARAAKVATDKRKERERAATKIHRDHQDKPKTDDEIATQGQSASQSSPFLIPSDSAPTQMGARDNNDAGNPVVAPPREVTPSNLEWINMPGIGRRQVGKFLGVEYVVMSVERVSAIDDTQADACFYLVNLVVANTNSRPQEIETDKIALLDEKEREYERSDEGAGALRSVDRKRTVATYSVKLQPSVVKHFTLVYDAPPDIKTLRLRIPDGYLTPIAAPSPG